MNVVDVWILAIGRKTDGEVRLRELLGERLGIAGLEVPLTRPPGGKPILDPDARLPDLRFNLSHSGERALIAIAEGIEVGVDLEALTRRTPDYLRDWCRREAYVKGTGTGLRGSPRHLGFDAAGAGRWRVLDGGTPVEGWSVLDLEVGEGYVAALAVGSEVEVSVSVDASFVEGG